MHRLVPLVALVALLALPPAALGAEPAPFGHACALKDGVRFCPTTDLAQRVASFDGVPLDVDVTLPATGDGPFPTIVMLHGYGGDKRSFEAATAPDALPGTTLYHYNTNYFAARGFAVVTTSARGFGHSCGKSDPAEPACASGWLHLADQRYELRDTQTLLGLLVDQGITKLDAIGVTGISYGGGQSLQLALLGDRVRLPDGSFAPWRSPAGKPLRLAAAYPRWPWSDLVSALEPNGRFLDFGRATRLDATTPIGVSIQSYTTALYAISGRLAPPGVDPTADLTAWNARIAQGEPYGADVGRAAGELADLAFVTSDNPRWAPNRRPRCRSNGVTAAMPQPCGARCRPCSCQRR